MENFRHHIDPGQNGHLPGRAHGAGQCAEKPVGEGAGEDRVGVLDCRIEDFALPAHDAVERRPGEQEHRREERSDGNGDDQTMCDQRRGVLSATRADGAGERGGERAAHGGIRHLLHKHHQREHERETGQRRRAQSADEMRVDAGDDGDQDDIDDQVRRGKPQQGRDDRPFQQQACARCRR